MTMHTEQEARETELHILSLAANNEFVDTMEPDMLWGMKSKGYLEYVDTIEPFVTRFRITDKGREAWNRRAGQP